MMRRLVDLWIFVSVGLFFCLLAPAGAAAKSVTLSYSTFFPSTHIQAKTAQAWCQEVEKKTDGRVSIQFYPGQTLTKANQTYDSITDGICDIGTSCLAYTPGRFPVMSSIDLPFGYPSAVAATDVANTLYTKLKPEEFSGTKVLYFNAHGPGYIHTREKPVQGLDDLKGLKIRSTGMSADVIKALGGSPVTMAMPDAYQALAKGVVDGSIHPVETNKGWNIGEVVDYMTKTEATGYTTTFFVVMNKKRWNAVDAKDQKIIEGINDEWAERHAQAWDGSDERGLSIFKDLGGEVITLTEAESTQWNAAIAQVIAEYRGQLKENGFDDQRITDIIENTLKEYKK